MDRNAFNFQEHAWREGHVDKDGKSVVTEAQKKEWETKHRVDTITMRRAADEDHPDGCELQVNAHAKDDIASWEAQGYVVVDQPKAPKIAKKAKNADAPPAEGDVPPPAKKPRKKAAPAAK